MILGYGVSIKQKSSFEPAGYVKVMAVCEELKTNLTHAKRVSKEFVEAVVGGVVAQ